MGCMYSSNSFFNFFQLLKMLNVLNMLKKLNSVEITLNRSSTLILSILPLHSCSSVEVLKHYHVYRRGGNIHVYKRGIDVVLVNRCIWCTGVYNDMVNRSIDVYRGGRHVQ